MTSPIDSYLVAATAEQLLRANEIRAVVHDVFGEEVEECLSYGMPGFRLKTYGKVVLGFALNKNSIGVYPHSGGILQHMTSNITEYQTAKSALNFPLTSPIPTAILREMLELRLQAIQRLTAP